MALIDNVKRMQAAGVPEEEIGKYIQEYGSQDEQNSFLEKAVNTLDTRPTYEMVGSAIGGFSGAALGAGAGGMGAAPGAVPVVRFTIFFIRMKNLIRFLVEQKQLQKISLLIWQLQWLFPRF